MKRINHTIRRKKIPEVKLVSLTEPSWYDYRESDENLISWNEWDYLIKYERIFYQYIYVIISIIYY